MKNFSFFLLLVIPFFMSAQDTLGVKHLEKYTTHFSINGNGKLEGDGVQMLKRNLKEHPVVLIGEYHGSPRVSEFTASLIHEMTALGCNKFVAEVGPIATKYINEIVSASDDPFASLKELCDQYRVDDYPPFPFFDNKGDKLFVDLLKKYNWITWGIDQEFVVGYQMLVDRSFEMLNEKQKGLMKSMMTEVKDSLKSFYEIDDNDGKRYSVSIKESKLIPAYFEQISELNPEIKEVADALFATNTIYYLNAIKKYLENNTSRARYMKTNMKSYMKASNFNLSEDRMLVKLGQYHAGRGLSPMDVYDVGNLMSELSELNGKKSLHLCMQYRYSKDEYGESEG